MEDATAVISLKYTLVRNKYKIFILAKNIHKYVHNQICRRYNSHLAVMNRDVLKDKRSGPTPVFS